MARPKPPRVRIEAEEYGWYTLAADGVALGTTALLLVATRDAAADSLSAGLLPLVGLLPYVFVTPALHLDHGNYWAIGSLLLRAPTAGLFFLAALFSQYCAGDPDCGSDGRSTLIMELSAAGCLAIAALDAAIAFDWGGRSHVALTPWVSPRADAGGLALVGRL